MFVMRQRVANKLALSALYVNLFIFLCLRERVRMCLCKFVYYYMCQSVCVCVFICAWYDPRNPYSICRIEKSDANIEMRNRNIL